MVNTKSKAPKINSMIKGRRRAGGWTSMCLRVAVTPRISPILQITEPTALPTASPDSPLAPAVMETTSSGVVVARLTKVEPITT